MFCIILLYLHIKGLITIVIGCRASIRPLYCHLLILGSVDQDHNFLLLNSASSVMRGNNHLSAILLKSAAILSNGEMVCSLVLTKQETISVCLNVQ